MKCGECSSSMKGSSTTITQEGIFLEILHPMFFGISNMYTAMTTFFNVFRSRFPSLVVKFCSDNVEWPTALTKAVNGNFR